MIWMSGALTTRPPRLPHAYWKEGAKSNHYSNALRLLINSGVSFVVGPHWLGRLPLSSSWDGCSVTWCLECYPISMADGKFSSFPAVWCAGWHLPVLLFLGTGCMPSLGSSSASVSVSVASNQGKQCTKR